MVVPPELWDAAIDAPHTATKMYRSIGKNRLSVERIRCEYFRREMGRKFLIFLSLRD